MITMQQLKALCAVIESGSISVAAERLCLSQPAVSKIIASLEHTTKLKLFNREHRRIVPTAEAHYLYNEGRQLLAGFTDITRLAEELRTLNAGSLSIASLHAFGSQIVPSVIADFLKGRPQTDLTYQIRSSNKIMQWAIAQQIDFGIAITTMEHEAVSKEIFCKVDGVCAMPKGHHLAERAQIFPEDLDKAPFISFVKEGFMRQAIDSTFSARGVQPRHVATVSNSHTACTMVLHTSSLSIVDPYSAMLFVPHGLIFKPFLPRVTYEFQLLWPRHRSRSKLAKMLLSEIRKGIKNYDHLLARGAELEETPQ